MANKRKSLNCNCLGNPEDSLRKATTLSEQERANCIRQMREITGGIQLPAVVIKGDTYRAAPFRAKPY